MSARNMVQKYDTIFGYRCRVLTTRLHQLVGASMNTTLQTVAKYIWKDVRSDIIIGIWIQIDLEMDIHNMPAFFAVLSTITYFHKGACLVCNGTTRTVYPKKYAHGFVVLYFVVVMQSFIMNSHEVFIHIRQGCFAGTRAIVRLPQCQWSKPDGYGKISQCITTTKHSKAKTVCIFLGIYCIAKSTPLPRFIYIPVVITGPETALIIHVSEVYLLAISQQTNSSN